MRLLMSTGVAKSLLSNIRLLCKTRRKKCRIFLALTQYSDLGLQQMRSSPELVRRATNLLLFPELAALPRIPQRRPCNSLRLI